MDHVRHITTMISHVHDVIDEYFELTEDILAKPNGPDDIDRAFVLGEGVGALREQVDTLKRLRYRIENEKGEV